MEGKKENQKCITQIKCKFCGEVGMMLQNDTRKMFYCSCCGSYIPLRTYNLGAKGSTVDLTFKKQGLVTHA